MLVAVEFITILFSFMTFYFPASLVASLDFSWSLSPFHFGHLSLQSFFSSFFPLWPPVSPLLLSLCDTAPSRTSWLRSLSAHISRGSVYPSPQLCVCHSAPKHKHVSAVRWVVLKHTPNWAQFGIISCLDSSGLKTGCWVSKGKKKSPRESLSVTVEVVL